jgi:hypothetical protein
MKILSIDVGIKNLAFCLLDKNNAISKWNVVNLAQKTEVSVCQHFEKVGQSCGKPAKYTKENKCYCLKHSKKQSFQIPTSELKPAFLKKQKLPTLIEIADKHKIIYSKNVKKADLLVLLNEYIYNTCFEPVDSPENASKIDLVTIGKNIQSKLDVEFENEFENIEVVVIENQISPIANRMKTIQGMISQYFIMRIPYIRIEFVNASNKLKDDQKSNTLSDVEKTDNKIDNKTENKTDKAKYSDRKKQGIQKSHELLNGEAKYQEWTDFFQKHGKKDDLADCFLQGLWFIKNKW